MKRFGYDFTKVMYYSDTTQQIMDDICEYLNDGSYESLDEAIFGEIDRALIYYEDQWNILKDFCVPSDANLQVAIEELVNLAYEVIGEVED